MVRRTRKFQKSRKSHKLEKSRGKVLTIPELRRGMDHISAFTNQLTKRPIKDESVEAFQSEWKAVFGKKLDAKVAKDYLKHVSQTKTKKFTKKMRGGVFYGAPTSYMTQPGLSLPYGNFPEYISKGFWTPEPAILQSCGKQEGVLPYESTGSNQVGQAGGSLIGDFVQQYIPGASSFAAIASRPYTAENPPTTLQNMGTTWKGQSTGPGAESWQQAWQPRLPSSVSAIPVATALERTLSNDIKPVP